MSEPDHSPDELLGLFGDSLIRQILLLTSETPLSANALADRLDVSRPTIYRRVQRLERYNLLQERLCTDRDGNHYRVFVSTVDTISFGLDEGELTITVEFEEELVDKLDGFMDGLGVSTRQATRKVDEQIVWTRSRGDPHHG